MKDENVRLIDLEIWKKKQETLFTILKPYHERAYFVLSHAIPKYVLINGSIIKTVYPFNVLRILALIRIEARMVCKTILNFDIDKQRRLQHEQERITRRADRDKSYQRF